MVILQLFTFIVKSKGGISFVENHCSAIMSAEGDKKRQS